jgi:hypothetical protein
LMTYRLIDKEICALGDPRDRAKVQVCCPNDLSICREVDVSGNRYVATAKAASRAMRDPCHAHEAGEGIRVAGRKLGRGRTLSIKVKSRVWVLGRERSVTSQAGGDCETSPESTK